MRAMLGVVSLLVVVAVVGLLAAKQSKSGALSVPAPALGGTPAQQSQQLQQRVQGDVAKALDAVAEARKEAVDK